MAHSREPYVRARIPLWVRQRRSGPPEVLIVDDDLGIADVAREILEHAGYKVTIANGGPEAFAQLNSKSFDLVLCDLMMPVLSGFELARLLTTWDGRPPMVAVTGYPVPEGSVMEQGYDALLRKPYDVSTLLGLANRLTGGQATTA